MKFVSNSKADIKFVSNIKAGEPDGWIKYRTCSQVSSFCDYCVTWVFFQIWKDAPTGKQACDKCLLRILDVKIEDSDKYILTIEEDNGFLAVNGFLRPPAKSSLQESLFDTETFKPVPPMEGYQSFHFFKPYIKDSQ